MPAPDQAPSAAERPPAAAAETLFESFDSWAQLLKAAPPAQIGEPAPAASAEAPIFHPLMRRPMGLLHIVDDGRETGETVRIRDDWVVIGRSEGQIVIPHDSAMSARHARIDRLPDGSWQLSDEGSAAGTLVRAAAARLRQGSVVQLGATRLLFEVDASGAACLVEVRSNHLGRRHECTGASLTVGRAGGPATLTIDDPFISPLHAEIRQTPRGWKMVNRGLNGLWMKLEAPVKMAGPSQFLCGEQRFVFEPLPGG